MCLISQSADNEWLVEEEIIMRIENKSISLKRPDILIDTQFGG